MDAVITQNCLWALATLVYIKSIVSSSDFLMNCKLIPADISRKIIHIAACSWCLFWPCFDKSHWTWKLNVVIPFLYSIQLFVKGAIICDPNDQDVKTMSRSGRPSELLYGPFLFTLIMLFCGLYEFQRPLGTYIMGSMIGDGIAPLVGRRFPFLVYPTLGGEKKTISGSLGMFLGSIVGILLYRWGLGVPEELDLETIFQIALVATLAEACTGRWDNPAITVTVYLFVKATDITIRI